MPTHANERSGLGNDRQEGELDLDEGRILTLPTITRGNLAPRPPRRYAGSEKMFEIHLFRTLPSC